MSSQKYSAQLDLFQEETNKLREKRFNAACKRLAQQRKKKVSKAHQLIFSSDGKA